MSGVVNFLQRIVMNIQIKPGLSIYFQLVLLLPCPQPRNHSRRPNSFPYGVHLKPRNFNVGVLEIWTIQGIWTIWDKFL